MDHDDLVRIIKALESIASSLALIAGVVDEVYVEERTKTVPASEVQRVPPPAAPRVPRARAQL